MNKMTFLGMVITIVFLAGCSIPRVTPIGNDVYIISSSSAFNGTSKKTEIIEEANRFAASKGKQAVQVSLKESHPAVGFGGQFEYQFKLVDMESSETIKSLKESASDEVSRQKELQRLGKLKDNGVITEEEFETLKAKFKTPATSP